TEDREVDVVRAPGVRMVLPRIRAGLDRHEPVAALVVGQAAARAAEVGVEPRIVVVHLVRVPAGGVRLPDLDQLPTERLPVAPEDTPTQDHSLAERVARVLAGQ